MQSKIESLQREVDANVSKISELTKTNQKMNAQLQNEMQEGLRLKEEMQSKIETLQQELADEG